MASVVVSPNDWKPGAPVYYVLGWGNHLYTVYNAGAGYRYDLAATYSLTSVGKNALRFEVRSGDTQWFDIGSSKERSEIATNERIEAGTAFHVSYNFELEQGPKNTANWVILGQIHQEYQEGEAGRPPPFSFQMRGEKMEGVVRWRDADGNVQSRTVFSDDANIVRGKDYHIDLYMQFDGRSDGHLVMVRDGIVLADYKGPLGFSDGDIYWQQGIYRQHANETIAAVYSDLQISSGDMVQFPEMGAKTHVLTEAPSLRIAESGMEGSQAHVTVVGEATVGATVQIYDGEHLIGRIVAGADGKFQAKFELNAGSHIFTAAIADGAGRLSELSHEVAAEVGTASDIVARLNALPAMTDLATILLTDSHTLTVSSIAQMNALIVNAGPALKLIDGDYNFGFWTGREGFRTFTTYDKAGTAVEAYTTTIRDGQTMRITHTIYSTESDIRMEITDYHIEGQAYTWAYRSFDKNSKLLSGEYYRADNTLVAATHVHADGSVSNLDYDASGKLWKDTLTDADGTQHVKTYSQGLMLSSMSAKAIAADLTPLTADVPTKMLATHDGDDFYIVKSATDIVHEEVGAGFDTVYTTLHRYETPANVESVTFTGTGSAVLIGNELSNVLTGGEGDDWLDGGLGADRLVGGKGNDTYIVDNVNDIVVEKPGGGMDTVRSSVSYTLPTDVESLILTGGSAIDATGNAGANILIGNNAANWLRGLAGDDILTGGGGNDILDGGDGYDIAAFSGRRGDYVIGYSPEAGIFTITDMRGPGFDGRDTATNIETFRFSDGDISADILRVNDAPVLADDAFTIKAASGQSLTISKNNGLLANDHDPDGDRIMVGSVNGESVKSGQIVHGKFGDLQVRVDGSFDYRVTSLADQPTGRHAVDHFTYAAFDVQGHTETASLDIILNRDPVARHDKGSFAGTADTQTVVGNVLKNDTDADGDRLSVASVAGVDGRFHSAGSSVEGRYGTLFLGTDGSYRYALSPDAPQDALAQERFVYTVSDGMGSAGSVKAFLDIDLAGRNLVEMTGGFSGSVTEDLSTAAYGDLYLPSNAGFAAAGLTGTYGKFTIGTNGHWIYELANASEAVQQLTRADKRIDSFTVRSEDGHFERIVSVGVQGSNDAAVVTGPRTAIISENESRPISGQLVVTDIDLGQAGFQAGKIAGQYGTLEIAKNGAWHYALNSDADAVQSLRGGEFASDTFRLQTLDGTVSSLRVMIRGMNDKALVSGDMTGHVKEGEALTASGDLKVSDRDAGESGFQAGEIAGKYGLLDIDSDGHWIYRLDHGTSAVPSPSSGEIASETLNVFTLDGTTAKLQFYIHGSEAVSLADSISGSPSIGHMDGYLLS